MRRVMILVAMLSMAVGLFAESAAASWVSDHCYTDNKSDSHVKRSEAQSYSLVGDDEGYEWGGGCWDSDNNDDTPGQPDSNGEGPDCSGFVFKTWEMENSYGQSGFQWWNKLQNIHGPYISDDFHDVGTSSSLPFYRLANKNRSTTLYMDAFARDGHVGMLYTSSNPSSDTDYIIEALSDSSGTDKNIQGYRYDDRFVAVRRKDWEADCYPNCPRLGTPDPVVVVV